MPKSTGEAEAEAEEIAFWRKRYLLLSPKRNSTEAPVLIWVHRPLLRDMGKDGTTKENGTKQKELKSVMKEILRYS